MQNSISITASFWTVQYCCLEQTSVLFTSCQVVFFMESTPSLHASPETFEENGIECISFALLSHTHTHTHSHTHTRTFSLFRYLNAKKLRQERWFGKGKSNSRFYVIVNYFLFDISNGLFPFAPQCSKTFFQCVFDFCLFVFWMIQMPFWAKWYTHLLLSFEKLQPLWSIKYSCILRIFLSFWISFCFDIFYYISTI